MNFETNSVDQVIDKALGYVSGFCDDEKIDEHHQTAIALVVEELIANLFMHGKAQPDGILVIELTRSADLVSLFYRDGAPPFDPHKNLPEDDRSRPFNEREVGGLGWPLIFDMCEDVIYARDGNSNKMTLTRRLK